MGLRANLLRTVLADLPEPKSVLTEPSERWDHLLGGRTVAGAWKRYGRVGTTCAVVVGGWLIDVGGPPEMINAAVEDGGSGFVIGQPVARLIEGAKKLGWFRSAKRGELPSFRPGDIYWINRDTGTTVDGSHVGVVLSAAVQNDGSLRVETADGGQKVGGNEGATRNVRTFRLGSGSHPVLVQSPSSSGWLEGWIAVGGDEADDIPPEGPGTSSVSDDSAGVIVAAALVSGAALLTAAWFLYRPPFRFWATKALRLEANAYGSAKAERFRRRFGLDTAAFKSVDPAYADVHDYIHTVTGTLPGPWEDEYKVLQLEELIRTGKVRAPRGIGVVHETDRSVEK